MPSDAYYSYTDHDRHLAIGVALTTGAVREAQARHELAPTSCIALGRLLTAAALAGNIQRQGVVSIQILGDGHLGQLFADVSPDGHLRGYLRNPNIVLPVPPHETPGGRRAVGAAVGRGILSVIRLGEGRAYSQSTVDLVSGEIDEDVETFLDSSDQVPTALACDVLLDPDGRVALSAGVVIQAMPEAQPGIISSIRPRLRPELAEVLRAHPDDPHAIARHFVEGAAPAEDPLPVRWQCRCSYERAVGGLKMLPPEELAQMVDAKEEATITCDFCRTVYVIPSRDVEQAFLDTITGRG